MSPAMDTTQPPNQANTVILQQLDRLCLNYFQSQWTEESKFTPFPNLPPELRASIWREALPARRVRECWGPAEGGLFQQDPKALGYEIAKAIKVVCKESYAVVAQRYRPKIDPSHLNLTAQETLASPPSKDRDMNNYKYYHDDIFYFTPIATALERCEWAYAVDKIRTLAFGVGDWETWINEDAPERHQLLKFSTLEEIILFDEHHCPCKFEYVKFDYVESEEAGPGEEDEDEDEDEDEESDVDELEYIDIIPRSLLHSTAKARGSYYERLLKQYEDLPNKYPELSVLKRVKLLFAETWTIRRNEVARLKSRSV